MHFLLLLFFYSVH